MSYVVAVPKMLRRREVRRASVRRRAADGKGGLACCQKVRRRGGRQITATHNESD